jgi:hypothetical protein
VKELDHLDLLLQAREYEQKGYSNLGGFFKMHYQHPTTSAIAQQIMADHSALKEKSALTDNEGDQIPKK